MKTSTGGWSLSWGHSSVSSAAILSKQFTASRFRQAVHMVQLWSVSKFQAKFGLYRGECLTAGVGKG